MATQTSQPSSFDTCHQVKLTYPAFSPDILPSDTVGKTGKTFVSWYFLPPYDVGNRYYPHRHLNAEGESLPAPDPNEYAFVSLYPTTATNKGSLKFFTSDPWVMGVDKFVGHISDATQYIGTTELRIDTFQAGTKKGSELERCLLVEARVESANNRRENYLADVAKFLVPLDTARLRKNHEQHRSQWLSDLVDLLERRSDRAVKHFDAQLDMKVASLAGSDAAERFSIHRSEKWRWKPARLPQYELAIDEMPWKLRNDNSNTSRWIAIPYKCQRCGDVCGEEQSPPLYRLDCEHTCCRTCVLILSNEQRLPSEVACPKCPRQIFERPLVMRFLAQGSTQRWYFTDTRYSSWENWERSCLDLIAKEDHDDISMMVNSRILENVWHHFVRKASEEPQESCPSHLRVYDWPEFDLAQTVIFKRLKIFNGRIMTFSSLREDLLDGVRAKFRECVLDEPLRTYMPVAERKNVERKSDGWLDSVFRRPGLYEFVEKMVERTLMFWIVRICDCKEAQATNDLYHHHGIRPFFYVRALEVQDIDQPLKTPSDEWPIWKADDFPDIPEKKIKSNLGEEEPDTLGVHAVPESTGSQESLAREVANATDVSGPRRSERGGDLNAADDQKPAEKKPALPAAPKPDTTSVTQAEVSPLDAIATTVRSSSKDSSRAAPSDSKSTSNAVPRIQGQGYVPATSQFIIHQLSAMLTPEPQFGDILQARLENIYHVTIEADAWMAAVMVLEQDRTAIVEYEGARQTMRVPGTQVENPSPVASQPPMLPAERLDDSRPRDDAGHDHAVTSGGCTESEMPQLVADRRAAINSGQREIASDLVLGGPGQEHEGPIEVEDDDSFHSAEQHLTADVVDGSSSSRDTSRSADTKSSSLPTDHVGKKPNISKRKKDDRRWGWGSTATKKRNEQERKRKQKRRDEAAALSAVAQTQAQGGQTQTAAANAQATQGPPASDSGGLMRRIVGKLFFWRS